MKEPITVSKTASIAEALRKIVNKDISRVLVNDDEGPVGIITERDIGIFLLTEQSDRKIDEIPITEIMNHLITVNHSASIGDCAKIMTERDISSLGVDFNGRTKGLITKTDLTKYYIENFVGEKRVGDIMTISFVSCHDNDQLYTVLSQMVSNHVSRIIVKDQFEIPIGVLSFRGLISKTGFGGTALAREAMTNKMFTVEHDDDLVMACITLIENNINGAAVLVNNKITGILSKTDVVLAIAAITKKQNDCI
ncbi:MAG: CBS domain-containing protein [Thaumarchaeota archaeon]|nr:CBS domain-containing protein [Nitrososphaerota archaeon]